MDEDIATLLMSRADAGRDHESAYAPAGGTGVQERVLRDGTRVPVAVTGGPALVLLHGLTDSWRSFQEVIAWLPTAIRVIAPTMRGHGDADRPSHGYSMSELAGDVVELLDQLAIPRAVVAGHSLGAAVALRMAAEHASRVAGLVLAGAFARTAGNAGLAELDELVDELADPVPRAVAEEFQVSTLGGPVDPEFLRMVVDETTKVPARVWRVATRGLLDADHAAGLTSITAPTVVLWGDRDELALRSDQDALCAAIPGARLLVRPGAGHALHWEQPELFAAVCADVVDRCFTGNGV
jgi:pimeloyl-ACP methyl ester carboxylesterase